MKTKNIPLVFAFVIVIAIVFSRCSTADKTSSTVKSPFIGVEISSKSFDLNTSASSTLTTSSGSQIIVPENAFIDKDNKPVTGNVSVSYTEYYKPSEVIASGIPMTYTENGITQNFQSAGMFRVTASQNENEVFLAAGKEITINMVSTKQDLGYRNYFLDETTGNWMDIGNEKIVGSNESTSLRIQPLTDSSVMKPIMLKKYDPKAFVFDLDIDYSRFPALKQFKGVIWQYAGIVSDKNNPEKYSWIFKEQWSDINIQALDEDALTFTLKLSNESKVFNTTVSPVLKGNDYDKALAIFKKKEKKFNESVVASNLESSRLETETKLVRSFTVNKMGIYNCDRIYNEPDALVVSAKFKFDKDIENNVSQIRVYHICGNDVIYYYPTDIYNFKFNPDKENKLVAVLPGNKLAVFTSDDFKNLDLDLLKNHGDSPFIFQFKTQNISVKSMDDLSGVLKSI